MSRLHKFWTIAMGVLREIFDENAYQRFLARTNSKPTTQSYKQFQREQESAIATNPRCC